MIVYKVVQRTGERSLTSTVVMGKAEKHYRPGVIHHAPRWLDCQGYHLTAFNKLRHAKAFNGGQIGAEIWRCEATGITRRLPSRCLLTYLCRGVLKEPAFEGFLELRWPEGTIMCKTIKLIKEVT